MDFKEVCAVFQGTIFYDDLHGDLKSIAKELDRRNSQPSLPGSVDDAASLLLLGAVWNLFSGDLEAADQHLSRLLDLEGETYGLRWAFRAHAYRALVHTWREYPRLFKACELNGPAMVTWRNARERGHARDALAWCRARRSEAILELDKVEFEVIQEICRVDHLVRWSARRLNPASEDYDGHANKRTFDSRVVSKSQKDLIDLRTRTLRLGLPAVSAYLSKTLYELFHSQGDPSAHVHLEKMRKIYLKMNDEAGVGLYWLIRGDHNLSPPFTSPLVLNFDIVDAADEFGGDSRVFHTTKPYRLNASTSRARRKSSTSQSLFRKRIASRPKAVRTRIATAVRKSGRAARGKGVARWKPKTLTEVQYLRRLSVARRCYAQAETRFARAICARGSAASILRTACSFIMEDMQASRFWSLGAHRAKIATLLGASRELCQISGDVQLEKLVDTHRLLTGTHNEGVRSTGRGLGYESQLDSNEVFGLCLALLSLRESFYFRYHLGAFSRSKATSEVSRQIIKSMTIFRTVWYQVMLAQMSMLKSFGLHGAVVWAGHLKDQWHDIGKECLPRAESEDWGSNTSAEFGFTLFQHYLKITVGGIIPIDSMVGEPDDFPGNTTLEILDIIHRTYPGDQLTKDWIELQEIHIKYYKAQLSHRRYTHMGELGEANRSLKSFLEDPQVLANDNLQTRAWIIDIAVAYGKPEIAEDIMSRIDDTDVIPRQYSIIGEGTKAKMERIDDARRSLKSLEIIFLCGIRLSQWDRASRMLEMLESASPGYCTSVTSYSKLWPWQRCFYTGLVREKEGQYKLAFQYFGQAFFFLREAQNSVSDFESLGSTLEMSTVSRLMEALTRRSIRWEKDLPGVRILEPTTDARIDSRIFHVFGSTLDYGSTVDYGSTGHNDEAVLFLEAARTRLVTETASPEKVAAQYKYQAWLLLRTKRRRTAVEEQEFQELNAEIDQVTAVLTGPGTGDESAPPLRSRSATKQLSLFEYPPQDLYAAIPSNAIVIYTALSDDGLSVFAISDDGIKVAYSIPRMTPTTVKNSVAIFWDLLRDSQDTVEDHSIVLRLIQANLSNALISPPVERCIAARDHVIFVPSGPLTRLPFGALIFKGNPLLLQKQVSQVPSLSALRALRQRFDSLATRPEVAGNNGTIRIIARPGSVRDQQRTFHRPLHYAGIEAKIIAHLSGSTAIDADRVTKGEFQNYLREAQILHLGTHGYNDADYPFNSWILLKEKFRVLDILTVRTQVALVTFGACLGGLGRPSDLGDIDGFSHAVLTAGASSYLGALWEVDDFATMMHMYLFYLNLFVVIDRPSIAEAWHFATRTLYNLEVEDKIRFLEIILSCWDVWEARGEDPGAFVQRGKHRLQGALAKLRVNSEAREFDFKRPAVWAAFSLVGYASIKIQSSLHGTVTEILRARQADGTVGDS